MQLSTKRDLQALLLVNQQLRGISQQLTAESQFMQVLNSLVRSKSRLLVIQSQLLRGQKQALMDENKRWNLECKFAFREEILQPPQESQQPSIQR